MTTSKKFPNALFLVLICGFGCNSVEIGDGAVQPNAAVFSDDFERSDLGKMWKRGTGENGSGKWTLKDGALYGSGLKNDPLWLTKPLPDNARITFDATALSADGDLKVEFYGDGKEHASGYIVIFGGWSNSLDVIARLDEHGRDRKAQKTLKIKANQTYKLEVSRNAKGTIVWKVDGKTVISFPDKKALRGQKHRHFAFSNWNAPVKFDNLKVYKN